MEEALNDTLKTMVRLSTPDGNHPPFAYVTEDSVRGDEAVFYTVVIETHKDGLGCASSAHDQQTIDSLAEIFMTHNLDVEFDSYGMKATFGAAAARAFFQLAQTYCNSCMNGEDGAQLALETPALRH